MPRPPREQITPPKPPAPPRQGRRETSLRWTVEQAGREFAVHRTQVSARLRQTHQVAGPDGCYSTAQMVAAIYGDKHHEELRRTKEEADKLALGNAKSRRELLDSDAVYRFFEGYFIVIRQRILASKLSREEQDALLLELHGLSYDEIKAASIGGDVSASGGDTDPADAADVPPVG